MKKILFIIYTYSLGGGAEKILSNVVNGLAEKTNYEISILEYANYGIKKENLNPNICVLPPIVNMNTSSKIERIIKSFLVHFCPGVLRKFYIKDKYDVEISFNYQIPSFLTSRKKNVYNIQWNHGDIYDLKNSTFKRFLQNISFKKADKIVSISKNTENSIIDLFPQYRNKLRIIYNGTNVALINREATKRTDITLKNNSIVFLGRLEPNKNPLKLIQYTQQLLNEGIDINLYLLGNGIQKKDIAEYIEKQNLKEHITQLGYISEPYPIIKQCRAVCMLSNSEGFPTVFTEGMALGKPFISTPVGGTKELSNNGKCGIIVNNYEEFKQAIKKIIFDTDNYEKMSNACNEYIKLFSYDKQIEDIIALIEEAQGK